MGTTCSGYVEVLSSAFEPGDDDAPWLAAVSLAPLVERHYLIFCRLFGVRCEDCHGSWGENRVPLARGRGLPARASWESAQRLARLEDVSWASLAEVEEAVAGIEFNDTDWGWTFVLEAMRLFGARHGEDRVRLVVGFTT